MSKMYELVGQYKALMDMAQDTDVDEQVILDTIEGIEGEIEVKADNYVKVIKQIEADEKAYMDEADRLANKAAVMRARSKRLKEILFMAMKETGIESIDANFCKIKVVNNGGKRPLIIDGNVPDRFVKLVKQNDNDAIREYIQELEGKGLACTWAHLEERGQHLSIR